MRDPSRAHDWLATGVVALLALGAFGVGRWLMRLAQQGAAAGGRPADEARDAQEPKPAVDARAREAQRTA